MSTRDYIMPPGGSIADRLIEESGRAPFAGAPRWSADPPRIDDLASRRGTEGQAYYQMAARRTELESLWPFYRPYQPEMPPPVRFERLSPPPPPALPPEPEPKLAGYEDSLMTAALFDWEMNHLQDVSNTPREGWVGSSAEVIPERLAEITVDSLFPNPPPPEDPWSWQ